MKNGEYKVIPAVWVVLFNDKSEIFLLRRANTGWRDGMYTVPAGHVEKDESPSAAAIRELHEEAGIAVTNSDLGEPLIYYHKSDDLASDRVTFFFPVVSNLRAYNAEPHKADEAVWVSNDNLPDTIVPLLRHALTDMRSGIYYSDALHDSELFKKLL